ncbi:MAG: VOC family protein [Gemmatimonadota bacterium]|nr:VOC family protein [Gemmatimonadota bacterium]
MAHDTLNNPEVSLRGAVSPVLDIVGVHHITLVARNLERSRSFYEKFLGLNPIPRPDYDFEGAWYRCGDLEIHLLVAEEHPDPSRRHIAFEVSDFERVVKSLDGGWVHVVGGPGIRPHDGSRFVFLQDPDGNLIEITCRGAKRED